MKKWLFVFILLFVLQTLQAQHLGANIGISVAKQFEINKKLQIDARQQLQITPDIKSLKTKKDDDIFNEIGLFPFSRDDRDDDDDDDDDKDDPQTDDPFEELNDGRQRIRMQWRSATTAGARYRLLKWLRVGQSYSLLLDEDQARHLFRTDVSFQPKLPIKKLSIPQRLAFQLAGRERRGVFIWEHDLSARSGIEWDFKKRHRLYNQWAINGAWDNKQWEWDRFRWDVGLQYSFNKVQRFDIGYRFQQRLDKKRRTSHGISFRYSINF